MMKLVSLLFAAIVLIPGSLSAQNLNSSNGGYDSKRIIHKKKFHVLYEEVAIDKTVDEVWNEVSGNFMQIGEIVKNVNSSRCLSGYTTE